MPTTVEALNFALIFVMPGFVAVRTREALLPALPVTDRGVIVFFALAVLLPAGAGIVWAVGYWQDWYPRFGGRLLPRLGIPAPSRGVGEDLWDRLWLSARRQMWLTVYTKEGPIYVGRGVEFGYSSQGRDVYLGDDTRVYDSEGALVREMRAGGGVGVWIPASEISSFEIYDPPAEAGR